VALRTTLSATLPRSRRAIVNLFEQGLQRKTQQGAAGRAVKPGFNLGLSQQRLRTGLGEARDLCRPLLGAGLEASQEGTQRRLDICTVYHWEAFLLHSDLS